MTENRPTKKQRELLMYIDEFIKTHGYGPSYREVMRALDYKSVSTVAIHVNGLIARGFLRKTKNSARSLEVMSTDVIAGPVEDSTAHIGWLENELAKREANPALASEAATLKAALAILDQSEKK